MEKGDGESIRECMEKLKLKFEESLNMNEGDKEAFLSVAL